MDVLTATRESAGRVRPLPLRRISYDPGRHVLELELGTAGVALRHFIDRPREIHVCESAEGAHTQIIVHDASGACTRILLSAPPGLREVPRTPDVAGGVLRV